MRAGIKQFGPLLNAHKSKDLSIFMGPLLDRRARRGRGETDLRQVERQPQMQSVCRQ